ncbi:MAG: tetratricopeptide repeat protein [Eubacterium sp.]|nr:tetratricopeptide repeat protein [Eubacterium sp.]MCM1217468.1 tetratricopeptide repeat protein [Lachnospiraceae bacterium]MCM1302510.1 tetratricopeptide repeat protein [Butyrivibrio sp.]MCM1344415.1 tetratricopeptide repeat protein [Muribaculaceae bacterium]MCM1065509.1 tetratricopeptide repeat protein [Eubacterium sp.]
MFCYNCGCQLSEYDFCTGCGADVGLYKKIMCVSNIYYNDGLERASVRDLSGAIVSLRQSLKFNKSNIEARNLLGLVYFEMGEVVSALREWVISKNMRPEKNIADDYIEKVQSNATRLDSINQTIKKYNQALIYCHQDSRDLAVIQLKKVLSMNPRFVQAHLLLALLYVDSERWERAERELKKCIDIDRNNTQALRYLREVENMLVPEENVKQSSRQKKDDSVRYRSDNEIIIQPLNVKEPKKGGVSTLVNIGIGLLIGMAAVYFLVVPAAQSNAKKAAQDDIIRISSESDGKTVQIQELEAQIASMQRDYEVLQQELEGYTGESGTLQTINSLFRVATAYMEDPEDVMATAADLESIADNVVLEETSEEFQALYGKLLGIIGPRISETYFTEGQESLRTGDYPAAVEGLSKAVYYDPENADGWFMLGQAYRQNGDNDKAIETYEQVIERFPDTERARRAQKEKESILEGN